MGTGSKDGDLLLSTAVLTIPVSILMFCLLASLFLVRIQYAVIDPGTGTLHT